MKNLMNLTLATVLSLSLAAACKTMTGESAGQNLDDTAITSTVKTKLATKERVGTVSQIGVKTVNGTVYLTGTAKTADEKARAEQIARGVGGVKSVVNDIQVQP